MSDKAGSEAEMEKSDSHPEIAKGSSVLVTQARCDSEYITATEKRVLRAVQDTNVSVHTSGRINRDSPHENMAKIKRVWRLEESWPFSCRLFYVTILHLGTKDVILTNYQKTG